MYYVYKWHTMQYQIRPAAQGGLVDLPELHDSAILPVPPLLPDPISQGCGY